MKERLGVGFVGAGFVVDVFHVRSWLGVRNADINAVMSHTEESARACAEHVRQLGVGEPATYTDVAELVRDESVDAVYVATPNHVRVEVIETICEEVRSGRAELVGIAIEKPLGRTVAEARRIVEAIEEVGLLHGYLEIQVFAPALTRARNLVWARGGRVERAAVPRA